MDFSCAVSYKEKPKMAGGLVLPRSCLLAIYLVLAVFLVVFPFFSRVEREGYRRAIANNGFPREYLGPSHFTLRLLRLSPLSCLLTEVEWKK